MYTSKKQYSVMDTTQYVLSDKNILWEIFKHLLPNSLRGLNNASLVCNQWRRVYMEKEEQRYIIMLENRLNDRKLIWTYLHHLFVEYDFGYCFDVELNINRDILGSEVLSVVVFGTKIWDNMIRLTFNKSGTSMPLSRGLPPDTGNDWSLVCKCLTAYNIEYNEINEPTGYTNSFDLGTCSKFSHTATPKTTITCNSKELIKLFELFFNCDHALRDYNKRDGIYLHSKVMGFSMQAWEYFPGLVWTSAHDPEQAAYRKFWQTLRDLAYLNYNRLYEDMMDFTIRKSVINFLKECTKINMLF